jgi:hypothetical protein
VLSPEQLAALAKWTPEQIAAFVTALAGKVE